MSVCHCIIKKLVVRGLLTMCEAQLGFVVRLTSRRHRLSQRRGNSQPGGRRTHVTSPVSSPIPMMSPVCYPPPPPPPSHQYVHTITGLLTIHHCRKIDTTYPESSSNLTANSVDVSSLRARSWSSHQSRGVQLFRLKAEIVIKTSYN